LTGQLHSFIDKQDLRHHIPYYLMEGFGLAIFMVSASYFTTLVESPLSPMHLMIPSGKIRLMIIAVAMGLTAYVIFYSPLTSPSGAHINPAVTLARLRLGQIRFIDACFYILSQCGGGLLAVYGMAHGLGSAFREPPINYVVTIPGKGCSAGQAAACELIIAFLMFSMILFTSKSERWQHYTKSLAALFVSCFVYVSGPISGFGMNPARSFASALPSGIWTEFPIYVICPVVGMWAATELYILVTDRKKH
jgi:aquaporin Z